MKYSNYREEELIENKVLFAVVDETRETKGFLSNTVETRTVLVYSPWFKSLQTNHPIWYYDSSGEPIDNSYDISILRAAYHARILRNNVHKKD